MDSPGTAIPDVSVIVAAYNVERYIERAILSALEQEGVSVEVIVVDDASTDNTIEAAENFGDKRVRIIRRSRNGGPAAARNEGLLAAVAPWIAILDGDDAFAPDRLRGNLARAENGKADVIVDNLEVRREADGTMYTMFSTKDFDDQDTLDLPTFIRGNSSFLGGKSLGYLKPLFRAAFLRKHRLAYDPDIRIGEDYTLLAEALACGARCTVNLSCKYLYTVRAGSVSHRLNGSDVERMMDGDRKFLSKYRLPRESQRAQKLRTSRLKSARLFTRLVDDLKNKRFYSAIKIILAKPSLIFHLARSLQEHIKSR
jgi:succinoglycan biosynthesis protein ExoO